MKSYDEMPSWGRAPPVLGPVAGQGGAGRVLQGGDEVVRDGELLLQVTGRHLAGAG